MIAWIKCLFTGHDPRFVRNIYGDEINRHGGKRSEWKCTKCGALRYEPELSADEVKS